MVRPKNLVLPFVVSVVGLFIIESSSAIAAVLTTTDSFDEKTIAEIHRCLNKFRVAQTPRDYMVYMVTGGLNTPNPDILHYDDGGNMTFAPVPRREPIYRFQQTSTSPATWMTNGGMVSQGPTTQDGFEPVPWVRKETSMGETYYTWDRNSYMTEYYFKKGSTFIVLEVSSGINLHYSFPQGVMSHLSPVGNPVRR